MKPNHAGVAAMPEPCGFEELILATLIRRDVGANEHTKVGKGESLVERIPGQKIESVIIEKDAAEVNAGGNWH